jgi:hypothetical protein
MGRRTREAMAPTSEVADPEPENDDHERTEEKELAERHGEED